MPDKRYLTQREGRWYYNRRLPKHLIGLIDDDRITKTNLIRYGLGTHNHKDAIRLRNIENVKWDAVLQAAEDQQPTPLAPNQAVRLVQEYVERMDKEWQKRHSHDGPDNEDQRLDMKFDIGVSEQSLTSLVDPRGDQEVSHSIKKILGGSNFEITEDSIPLATFGNIVRRGLIELYRRHSARLDDDYSNEFIDQMFAPKAKVKATFGELCDQFMKIYRDEASSKKVNQQQINQTKSRVNIISQLIGRDMPVNTIDYDLCLAFRNQITGLPQNWIGFQDLPIDEVLKKTANKPAIGHGTQSEYLRLLTKVLDLAHKKGLIPVVYSSDMTPITTKVANKNKRDPFSNDQIKTFFQSSYYNKCGSEPRPFEHAGQPWRFWLPLMCLTMGLRPKEVCQMNLADIKKSEDGVLYVHIIATDDDDESPAQENIKTVKTEASRRIIPVHPELLKIGFAEYVEATLSKSETMLFPGLKPNKYGNYAVYPLKRFREKFLPDVLELKKTQSFYSFRHSFRDALRRMEAPPEILQALGAWSQGNLVSDDYGGGYEPNQLLKYVEKIEYPILDLSYLYVKK